MANNTYDHNDGSYVVKKSRKSSIFAFIICFLIAFVIWAYSMSYGAQSPNSGEQNDSPTNGNTQVEETQ